MVKLKNNILICLVIVAIIVLPLVNAELTIDKKDKGSTLIIGLNNPAIYDLIINNTGANNGIEIYSLVGMIVEPRDRINLTNGINTINIKAYPIESLRKEGIYYFEYYLKTESSGLLKEELPITFVELKDSLAFKADNIELGEDEAKISVKNTQNSFIDNIKIKLSSVFFNAEKTISLEPYEETNLSVGINKASIKELAAGTYIIGVNTEAGKATAKFETTANYIKKEDVSNKETSNGIIIRKIYVEKTNNGNVPVKVALEIKKDIFSRLFTIYSLEPTNSERSRLFVSYIWEKEIKPSQTFSVSATTNYTFPFLFVLLVAIIIFLVYSYTKTNLVLQKRVSFVKTSSGHFALKVTIRAKAKKYIEDIQIIDRLPGMTRLYEKFGVKPDKIDAATRRLFWDIGQLNAGEERVFSYIIYSKVKVIGKFELPLATAVFEREGKTHEVLSNRAFFVAEMTRTED
jgi:hypothetical protein